MSGPRQAQNEMEEGGVLLSLISQWNNTNQILVKLIAAIQGVLLVSNVLPGTYLTAGLPAGVAEGTRATVTDATSATYNAAPTGGGAQHIGVIYLNGAWRIG